MNLWQYCTRPFGHSTNWAVPSLECDHVQCLLQALHWLPDQARIDYKLSTVCHNFFSDSSPAHFSDLLAMYAPSMQLPSSADTWILPAAHVRTKSFGQRCFSCWSLLYSILSCLQHCIKHPSTNSTTLDFRFCLLTRLPIYPPSPLITFLWCVCVCVCARVCVCVCACVCVCVCKEYNIMIIFFRF